MKTSICLVPLALVALGLTACSTDQAAPVIARAASSAAAVSSSPEVSRPAPDSSASVLSTSCPDSAVPVSSSAAPTPTDPTAPAHPQLGDTVRVGDWNVKVTDLDLHADSEVAGANEFNDKPTGEYVLVSYEATYVGQARSAYTDVDLRWSYTTSDHQVHDPALAVTPDEHRELPTEARTGCTVKGQVAFDLAPAKVHAGTLTVSGYTADLDQTYAHFHVA